MVCTRIERTLSTKLPVSVLFTCALLCAFGIAAIEYASFIPIYSVKTEFAMQAWVAMCTTEGKVSEAAQERYFSLFTDHFAWIDGGTGLIVGSAAVAALVMILHHQSRPDGMWLRTPTHRWQFLALGTASTLWFFASALRSFMTDFDRGYFPWCADSMGIPLFYTIVAAALITPPLVLGGWIVTRFFGSLPVRLGGWDALRPRRSWMITLATALAMFPVLALLLDAFRNSMSVAVPAYVIAIYLIEATRAALLSQNTQSPELPSA